MRELERNFSPINSQKTFGVRYGLAKLNTKNPKGSNKQVNDPAMGISPEGQGKMNNTMINFGTNSQFSSNMNNS